MKYFSIEGFLFKIEKGHAPIRAVWLLGNHSTQLNRSMYRPTRWKVAKIIKRLCFRIVNYPIMRSKEIT